MLADDCPLVREGLCRVLANEPDLECVGIATTGEEAVELAQKTKPDVAIIDSVMPGIDSLDAAKRIIQNSPHTAILIISAFKFNHDIIECMTMGIRGYLLKNTDAGELCNAIRMIHSGKYVFGPEAAGQMKGTLASDNLNEREIEIIKLAAKGMGNKEIAHELKISRHTVGSHFFDIFRKLGVESRTEAVLCALKDGILSMDDVERPNETS
jgi:DNA-binding NarL/FixJ family response regulator